MLVVSRKRKEQSSTFNLCSMQYFFLIKYSSHYAVAVSISAAVRQNDLFRVFKK